MPAVRHQLVLRDGLTQAVIKAIGIKNVLDQFSTIKNCW
jgi:hypothetical protein